MIITTQPSQPIIDKEIKDLEKDKRVSRGTSTTSGSKPIFNRQDLEAEKLSLIEQKLGELTNKLLASLKAGESGPNTPKTLQVAPNLASDIKELIKELEGNEKLKGFKESLEKFIKPIEHMKAGDVAKSVQNSGIMLEAKIAQALESQNLPAKIKELLSLMKNTNSTSLKESFLQLPNDSDAQKSINDLNKLLNAHKASNQKIIDHSTYKELFKAGAKLENAVKYIDKLSNLSQNISPKQASKLLANIENSINQAVKTVNSYNLNSQSLASAKTIKEQILQNANELKSALNMLKERNPDFKNNLSRIVKNSENSNENNAQNTLAQNAQKIRINMQSLNPQSSAPNPNGTTLNTAPNTTLHSAANQANPNAHTAPNAAPNTAPNQPNATNSAPNAAPNQPNTASNQPNSAQNAATNAALNQSNQPSTAQNQSNQEFQSPQNAQFNNAQFNQNAAFKSQFSTQFAMPDDFRNLNMMQFKEAINSDINGSNLQGKINQIAKGITSLQNILSEDAAQAKQNLGEIKSLQRAALKAAKQIGQISDNNSAEAMKNLQNDFKSVLLNLKESTSNQNNLQNINQAVNRMLTQIEIHQLASFSQNSLQTYLPYTWDELDSSHVSFKRGNKDKFYARIELNFVKFGDISVVLGISENKYLDVSIQTGSENFKNIILKETTSLKKALNEQGLIVNSFFLSTKSHKSLYQEPNNIDLGYSVKA